METSAELNKIKKTYGERFMKMCREYFPTILEKEGVLYEILTSSFADNSKTLYDDIKGNSLENNFKNHIYSKFNDKYNKGEENTRKMTEKTPYELLDEAGYDLFECKTEEEIQTFRKYYAPHEELCTFHDRRLDSCVVFFAVKKDVDNIKRENFKHPKREDEYGTSVMGIQFTKGLYSTVSIKNRYNHTVENPDATYGNNLEKVAPGLTESFKKMLLERGLNFNSINASLDGFEIPNYVLANDGKYYKYNLELNAKYYCPGNVIIEGGKPIKLRDPEKRMLIDYFVIDRENKTLQVTDKYCDDCFVDDFKDIEKIDVINDKEEKNGKKIILIQKKNSDKTIKIKVDKDNKIIGYENENLKEVGDSFLRNARNVESLSLPNLINAGERFLCDNNRLKDINLSNLEEVGGAFLYSEEELESIKLPKLKKAGVSFLFNNIKLKDIEIPNLEEAESFFLEQNLYLENFYAPKLKKVGRNFLSENKKLKELNLPELVEAEYGFLSKNITIESGSLPKLEKIEGHATSSLKNLKLPKLQLSKSDVTPKKIAELDKENNITTSEIDWARESINELSREQEKELESNGR